MGAKGVLVNAWATWCDSCQHELPMLQKFADAWAAKGVRVMLVSVDEPEDRDRARKFLADSGIHLPSYLAARPLGDFKSGMSPRWPGMLPASFLFDGAGKLRYFWGGEAFENELTPVVEGLVTGRRIDGESRFDLAPGATSESR
jgi:thiol-disulfide isomerase/thioredoxin